MVRTCLSNASCYFMLIWFHWLKLGSLIKIQCFFLLSLSLSQHLKGNLSQLWHFLVWVFAPNENSSISKVYVGMLLHTSVPKGPTQLELPQPILWLFQADFRLSANFDVQSTRGNVHNGLGLQCYHK